MKKARLTGMTAGTANLFTGGVQVVGSSNPSIYIFFTDKTDLHIKIDVSVPLPLLKIQRAKTRKVYT